MDTEQVKNSETGYVLVVFRGLEPVATSISVDAEMSVDDVRKATTRAIAEATCAEKPNTSISGADPSDRKTTGES